MQRNFRTSMGITMTTVAALLALLAAPAVAAEAPQPASGDFDVVGLEPTSVEPRGDTCHIALTATFDLEGTFEGTFVADFRIVHFGACDEPAPEHFVANGTFTGEVDGAVGSFDFVFVGDIDAAGFAEGKLVIGRGADGLAGLSGQVTLSGVAGVAGSYDGRIHFAR